MTIDYSNDKEYWESMAEAARQYMLELDKDIDYPDTGKVISFRKYKVSNKIEYLYEE